MKKRINWTSLISIITGIVLMLISFSIYLFHNYGYWGEVQSEIFGAGIAVAVFGVVYLIFKRKIG